MAGATKTGYWNISDMLPKVRGKQRHIWMRATSSFVSSEKKYPCELSLPTLIKIPRMRETQKSWGSVGTRGGCGSLPHSELQSVRH